jgi:hypothetical protein
LIDDITDYNTNHSSGPHTNHSSGTTQTTPLTLPLISKHMTTEAVGISDWLNSGDHGL